MTTLEGKTVVSSKGQIVVPKPIRDKLGLTPGTVLRVRVEDGRVVLEPVKPAPREIFVEAGPRITGEELRETKKSSDKIKRLLADLGVLDDRYR
ncbi:MAG TPA: AbrB/MazE/SpoVT family DNA-binding domain-containing protein [Candidatus Korarchaeota archaeon]|nr:AbrB/MazE/SpoVT family DNA-binding domain-containing protein [Candidatus Korarchaeota archaeon]